MNFSNLPQQYEEGEGSDAETWCAKDVLIDENHNREQDLLSYNAGYLVGKICLWDLITRANWLTWRVKTWLLVTGQAPQGQS